MDMLNKNSGRATSICLVDWEKTLGPGKTHNGSICNLILVKPQEKKAHWAPDRLKTCKAVDESCLEAPAQATCKSNKSLSCSTAPHSMFKVSTVRVQKMFLLALLGIETKCKPSHFLFFLSQTSGPRGLCNPLGRIFISTSVPATANNQMNSEILACLRMS